MPEEEGYTNKHLRETGGFKARKKRGEDIKEEMEDYRVIRSLKMEQGIRSGQGEPEFDFMIGHIFC